MPRRKKKQEMPAYVSDSLVNVVANLGTSRDKSSHSKFVHVPRSATELLTIYRNNWIAGAAVDYAVEDATRNWRWWRGSAEQINAIENIEKRLKLKRRVREAMMTARLYGGGAIYISTGTSAPDKPINEESEQIKTLVVFTPQTLQPEDPVRDISSEYYGVPEFYSIVDDGNSNRVRIHASRLAIFTGRFVPFDYATAQNKGWGDSVLMKSWDDISKATEMLANINSLVYEAKIDVLKLAGFADLLRESGGDNIITKRLLMQVAMKGINGALVVDREDEYDQKSANFGSLPELIGKFMEVVSGAVGVPVTRLFGRAAVGLSGSGDGDERIYYDRIKDIQELHIGAAIEKIDKMIEIEAVGSDIATVFYEWVPLRQLTESERSDIFSKTAAAARAIAGAGSGEIIPLDALSDSLVNALTEMGLLPGLEKAIKQYGTLAEQDEIDEEGDADDPILR